MQSPGGPFAAIRGNGNPLAVTAETQERRASPTSAGAATMAKKPVSPPPPAEIPVATVAPPAKRRTVCPLTHEQFMRSAPVLKVTFADGTAGDAVATFLSGPRKFSTGSVGYNVSGKLVIVIDGKAVEFQVGLNVTAVGSKP